MTGEAIIIYGMLIAGVGMFFLYAAGPLFINKGGRNG